VRLLLLVAVVLAGWFLASRWKASRGPRAAQRAGVWMRGFSRGIVAVLAVVLLIALAQGCEGDDEDGGGPEREPCTAFHVEDCPPEGGGPTTTTGGAGSADVPRVPCPAYRAEDCPVAPPAPPATSDVETDEDGVTRQVCAAYRLEDCPPA